MDKTLQLPSFGKEGWHISPLSVSFPQNHGNYSVKYDYNKLVISKFSFSEYA